MAARATGPAPAGHLYMEEVAERLGVKVTTLRKWRRLHTGPQGFRHAGRIIYPEAAVEAHLAACMAADPHSNPEIRPTNRPIRPHLGRAAA